MTGEELKGRLHSLQIDSLADDWFITGCVGNYPGHL